MEEVSKDQQNDLVKENKELARELDYKIIQGGKRNTPGLYQLLDKKLDQVIIGQNFDATPEQINLILRSVAKRQRGVAHMIASPFMVQKAVNRPSNPMAYGQKTESALTVVIERPA